MSQQSGSERARLLTYFMGSIYRTGISYPSIPNGEFRLATSYISRIDIITGAEEVGRVSNRDNLSIGDMQGMPVARVTLMLRSVI